MTHGSLFSGIGGFDLAAEWIGWENKFHCEWNEFGQRVLKHYWPNAESFHDITKTDFTKYANQIDVLTGGFPCQPYSTAGKRLGKEDERHLWPEMCRAIREIAPRWVVGENVRGLTNWNGGLVFDEVCADLENLGYQVAPYLIPASGVNAPHKRERIWFVAYANGTTKEHNGRANEGTASEVWRQNKGNVSREFCRNGNVTNSDSWKQKQHTLYGRMGRIKKQFSPCSWNLFPTQHPICGGNDGLSRELDGITFSKWRAESIKAYGNAVVPQVVYQIFKAIQDYENF